MSIWSEESSPQRVPTSPTYLLPNISSPIVPDINTSSASPIADNASNNLISQVNCLDYSVCNSQLIVTTDSSVQSSLHNCEDRSKTRHLSQSPIITSCCSYGPSKNSQSKSDESFSITGKLPKLLSKDLDEQQSLTQTITMTAEPCSDTELSRKAIQNRRNIQLKFAKPTDYPVLCLFDNNELIFA